MHLTRRGNLLLIGLLLLGAISQWTPESSLAGIWTYLLLCLLGLIAIEAFHARHLELACRLADTSDRTLPLGRVAQLNFSLTASSPRRISLRLKAYLPDGLQYLDNIRPIQQLTVTADEAAEFSLPVRPTALGSMPSAMAYSRVLGRLGLAWWTRSLPVALPLTCVPDRLRASELKLASGQGPAQASLRRGQGNELMGLRDYRPGDPLRQVDWKASARRGKTIVREFTEDLSTRIVIVLDTGRSAAVEMNGLSRLNHYINVCARLGQQALQQGDSMALITYAGQATVQHRALRGMDGLRELRRSIGELKAGNSESNSLAAALAIRNLPQTRSLVLWFSELDEAGSAGQLMRSARLLVPKHLPLVVHLQDQALLAMTRAPARDWLDPYRAYAAMQAQAHQQDLRRRLHQLGGEVVSALPDQLDAAVRNHYQLLRARKRI